MKVETDCGCGCCDRALELETETAERMPRRVVAMAANGWKRDGAAIDKRDHHRAHAAEIDKRDQHRAHAAEIDRRDHHRADAAAIDRAFATFAVAIDRALAAMTDCGSDTVLETDIVCRAAAIERRSDAEAAVVEESAIDWCV